MKPLAEWEEQKYVIDLQIFEPLLQKIITSPHTFGMRFFFFACCGDFISRVSGHAAHISTRVQRVVNGLCPHVVNVINWKMTSSIIGLQTTPQLGLDRVKLPVGTAMFCWPREGIWSLSCRGVAKWWMTNESWCPKSHSRSALFHPLGIIVAQHGCLCFNLYNRLTRSY